MDLPSAIFHAACRWQVLLELVWLVPGLAPGGVDPVCIQRQILEPANRRVAAIERLSEAGLLVSTDSPLYRIEPDWLQDLEYDLPYDYIGPLLDVGEGSGYSERVDDAAIDISLLANFPNLYSLACRNTG